MRRSGQSSAEERLAAFGVRSRRRDSNSERLLVEEYVSRECGTLLSAALVVESTTERETV